VCRQRVVAVAVVRGVDDDGLQVVDLSHAEVEALVVSSQRIAPMHVSSVYGRKSH
jgi:hypothetical protein